MTTAIEVPPSPGQGSSEPWRATHVLSIRASDSRRCLEAILDASGAEAEIRNVALRAQGADVEATLRLTELTCPEAREVCARIAERPGIEYARIEHHLLISSTA